MSKKSKKGKTMALTDFLASEPKLVTVRESTWAAIVDEEDEKQKLMVVDMSELPTAPRSAVDIDYSTIPNEGPFVAHVANLSFEIDDEGLRRIFADLNPREARIMRDGIRSRGTGFVEFHTRENLIEALKRTDKEIYGRKIRINFSDKKDLYQTNNNNRTNFGHRSNRTGEERSERAGRWERIERKSDDSTYDRQRSNRNDQGRSNYSGNSRDGQRSGDYGYGYPRTRDDRQGGTRQRYNNNHDDDNRSNSGMDRPRYAGRYSDTHDSNTTINFIEDDNREPPKERPRLNLQPRTKPIEEFQTLSTSSSSVNNVPTISSILNTDESPNINENSVNNLHQQESHDTSDAGSSVEPSISKPLAPSRGAGASIFGGAKPVDTAARELEIEKKLKELQMANSETGEDQTDKGPSSRSTYSRTNDRDNYRNRRSSHNHEERDDDRPGHEPDYHHKREYSGGRKYENDSVKNTNDDYHRHHRDRYNNSSRRDHDTVPSGKYNHHDRDNYRYRDPEYNQYNNHRRLSDDHFNNQSQLKNQPRTIMRRTIPTEDQSTKLQLSNKFVMLDDDDLDVDNAQSPIIDE